MPVSDDTDAEDLKLIPQLIRDCLSEQREYLVDNISDIPVLLNALLAKKCFTQHHVQSVQKETMIFRQIEEMLDILVRRSLTHYRLFMDCLRSTKQGFIADTIQAVENGEGKVFETLCQI